MNERKWGRTKVDIPPAWCTEPVSSGDGEGALELIWLFGAPCCCAVDIVRTRAIENETKMAFCFLLCLQNGKREFMALSLDEGWRGERRTTSTGKNKCTN